MRDLIEKFRDHLRIERNASAHTLRSYGADLEQFLGFLKEKNLARGESGEVAADKIDPLAIRAFLSSLYRDHKKSSLGRKLAALRSFLKYLVQEGYLRRNPAEIVATPRQEKPLPNFMPVDEAFALMETPDASLTWGARDKAILETLYSTGMRVSELVGLSEGDVDSSLGIVRVFGKGGKERIVPIGEKALEALGRECDVIIRDNAAAVFVSTAISQSGRLDTIFVLTAHFRMIGRIASVYSQRPALRDLVNIYANVAASAFVAGELDEAEIGEQIEPILSSALGAVSLSVPGVQAAASIVVTSILTGAANAFLTLRVGIIARRWCGSLVVADRRTLRRTATAEAAKLLGTIVKSGTARISRGLWAASKDKVGGAFSGLTGFARDIKDSLFALLKLKKGEE